MMNNFFYNWRNVFFTSLLLMQPIWENFYIYGVYKHIFVYVAPFFNYEELYNLSLSCKDLNEIIYPFLVKKCMMIRKVCAQSLFRNLGLLQVLKVHRSIYTPKDVPSIYLLKTGAIDEKHDKCFDVIHDYLKFTKYQYPQKLKFEGLSDDCQNYPNQ